MVGTPSSDPHMSAAVLKYVFSMYLEIIRSNYLVFYLALLMNLFWDLNKNCFNSPFDKFYIVFENIW
jgi:hypothetical protein